MSSPVPGQVRRIWSIPQGNADYLSLACLSELCVRRTTAEPAVLQERARMSGPDQIVQETASAAVSPCLHHLAVKGRLSRRSASSGADLAGIAGLRGPRIDAGRELPGAVL